jgi:hypothetical protein
MPVGQERRRGPARPVRAPTGAVPGSQVRGCGRASTLTSSVSAMAAQPAGSWSTSVLESMEPLLEQRLHRLAAHVAAPYEPLAGSLAPHIENSPVREASSRETRIAPVRRPGSRLTRKSGLVLVSFERYSGGKA